MANGKIVAHMCGSGKVRPYHATLCTIINYIHPASTPEYSVEDLCQMLNEKKSNDKCWLTTTKAIPDAKFIDNCKLFLKCLKAADWDEPQATKLYGVMSKELEL